MRYRVEYTAAGELRVSWVEAPSAAAAAAVVSDACRGLTAPRRHAAAPTPTPGAVLGVITADPATPMRSIRRRVTRWHRKARALGYGAGGAEARLEARAWSLAMSERDRGCPAMWPPAKEVVL
jgi:hypothetical protein